MRISNFEAKNGLARSLFTCFAVLLAAASTVIAQNPAPFRGQVADERGAIIAGARITLVDADGKKRSGVTNATGEFTIPDVPKGVYTLTVEFKGFQTHVEDGLQLPATSALKITLAVAQIKLETDVKADNSGVSVEPDQNLNALILDEKMIMDLLPDNEDDLRDFLLGLAGPAAGGASGGQGGAQIYVDGFPGGRLPPREAILQIRINQNPFSAEYAHPGIGRIEIITRPGTEQWHGSSGFNLRNSVLDARNAFALTRPDIDQRRFSFTLSGPIIKKKMSFFLNAEDRRFQSGVIVNAKTLDGDFIANVPSQNDNRGFGLRVGTSINKKNALNVGYNYRQSERISNGGGFTLPDRGQTSDNSNHTLTISETYLVNPRLVHETRARFQHESSSATANTPGIAINVLDAFNGGGATCCPNNSRQDQLNLQDYLTFTHKKHTLRGGLQVDYENNRDLNAGNFNGTYTFSSLEQYRQVLAGQRVDPNDPASPLVRATQFTINRGDPLLRYGQYEASWFIQDDIRMRPNFTLSAGLRHEFQSHLQDKLNFAPRLGIAWSPFKDRKTTFRTGGGIFFNRLNGNLYENTIRFDGVTQQSIVIRNPIFDPDDPLGANPGGVMIDQSRTIKRVLDPGLVSPYTINFTTSLEHQFPYSIFASVTQIYARGVHFFRSRNINAPLPDTGVRPDPTEGNIYQLESAATSRYNGFMFRVDRRFNRSFSVFSNYTLSWTNSDSDGPQGLPANSYDVSSEWGRAFTDRRHYLFITGMVTLPHGLRFTPMFQASSGGPFNITTGQDDNRDTVINDRPAGIHRNSDLPASLYSSIPNRCIANCESGGVPVLLRDFLEANYPNGVRAVGPGSINVNLSVSKTFSFGRRAGRLAQNGGGGQPDGSQPDGSQPGGQDQAGGPDNGQGGGRGGPGGGRGGPAGGRAGGAGGLGGGRGGGGFGGGGGRGGGRGGGGGRRGDAANEASRYSLQFSSQITNIFNHVNPGQFSGVLTSPFFGRSNRAGEARHLEFNLRFSF